MAAEKQIGTACTSDANSADFDTIAQCQGGTFVKAPLFMGSATGYACTGGANAGLVQWTGSAFQGCDGTAWNALTSLSGGVLLGTATGATNPQRGGDLTTGLFSPATGVVAFATAGLEALRVTATGSVGIGTASPYFKVEVDAGGSPPIASFKSTNNGYVDFTDGTRYLRLQNVGTKYNIGASGIPLAFLTQAAERMRIDGSGNVGIGTTSPTGLLSLGGDSARTFWMERTTTGAANSLTVQSGGSLGGATNANGGDLLLASGISTGTGTSKIQFLTASATGSGMADNAPSAKMTILGNGNVGIGVSAPTQALDIVSSQPIMRLLSNAGSSSVSKLGVNPGDGNHQIGWWGVNSMVSGNSPGTLSLSKDNTSYGAWAIVAASDSSGFETQGGLSVRYVSVAGTQYTPLSIGTLGGGVFMSSLSLGGSISITGALDRSIQLDRGSGNVGHSLTVQAGGSQAGGTNYDGGALYLSSGISTGSGTSIIQFLTASATGSGTADSAPSAKMTILGNGNVGIGTTSPITALEVNSSVLGTAFSLRSGNTYFINTGSNGTAAGAGASDPRLRIWNNANSTTLDLYGSGVYDHQTQHIWDINNVTKMILNSAGNVGIGTTSPQATLDVNGYAKLKVNASAPVTCDAAHEGSIAYTGTTTHYLCFCDGTGWKQSHSPATTCTW